MIWDDFEELVTDGIAAQGRHINLYTGMKGNEMIVHTMVVENAVGFVEWMMEKDKVDQETGKNLINMLRSEDKDNFNIAILAIEQLKK